MDERMALAQITNFHNVHYYGLVLSHAFIMISGAGHGSPALHFLMAWPAYLAEGMKGQVEGRA